MTAPDASTLVAPEVPVLPAATVMLLRDSASGLEVCLLRRNARSSWIADVRLFPGGAVEAEDASAAAIARCVGLDDAAASLALGMPRGGLAWWVAVAREAFEEAGVMLATPEPGAPDPTPEAWAQARHDLITGQAGFTEILTRLRLRVTADQIVPLVRWVTPESSPRRYDTRFFVAHAPSAWIPDPDGAEIVEASWIDPAVAVRLAEAGELRMLAPTLACLRWLAAHESVDHALETAGRSDGASGQGPAEPLAP